MIKFFRNIRQRLITKNKFSKYLIYAFGEIILVVIGILLALQVNNWNEDIKTRKKETQLIENLKSEYQTNLAILKEIRAHYKDTYSSTNQLLKLVGKSNTYIQNNNTDSLLFHAILIADFQPNQFVISSIMTGENIDVIRSEELKRLLYIWDKELSVKTEAYNMLNTYFMNSLIPFLDEYTSMANIDQYGYNEWSRQSILKHDSSKIFEMVLFENRLENHIWCINAFNSSIDRLISLCEQTVDQITSG